MHNPYRFLDILNTSKLSSEEFMFAYFIYLRNTKNREIQKALALYIENNKEKYDYSKIIDSLEEHGYIINTAHGTGTAKDPHRYADIKFTEKFISLMFVEKDAAWQDVVKLYPRFMKIKGKKFPLFFTDIPNIKEYYFKNVIGGGDKLLHAEFLALTDRYYGQHKGIVTHGCKLQKYLYSWDMIKFALKDAIENNTNLKKAISFEY